jgi:hypothetical protein
MDGDEEVSIVMFPSAIDEVPYNYALLPSSAVFQSLDKNRQTAYDEYKKIMKEEKDFNDTTHELRDNMNMKAMQRIMCVCVAMKTRSLLWANDNTAAASLDIEDVKKAVSSTDLGSVMKYYYQIGLALRIQVNTPSTILTQVKTDMVDVICDIAINGAQDDDVKAVYLIHTKLSA